MSTSSWYRRTLWNYKGNREYTRTGYEAAKLRFIDGDLDVDCTDRQYMITGCNSGIGLEVALEIAKRGGIIHMVCRNQESAKKARSEIITTTGNDKIHLHIVDLSRPRDVIQWVEKFAAQNEYLNVLVNNAGCMVHERRIDADGVETNFAVNTLAVHIITTTLIPLLRRSEDARVVMVSSAGLLHVKLDPVDLMHESMNPFLGNLVYSQNKRQQVVMTLWYAQRYDKIHFSSMHPGWADTNAVRTSIPLFYEAMKDNLRTASQGADTAVWLAIAESAAKHPSGLFFQDREPVSTHLPLAWTKSTIEEEDLLMKNVQDIYLRIHEQAYKGEQATEQATGQAQEQVSQVGEGERKNEGAEIDEQKNKEMKEQEKNEGIEKNEGENEGTTKINEEMNENKEKEAEIVRLPPPPAPRKDEPQNIVANNPSEKVDENAEIAETHAPLKSGTTETSTNITEAEKPITSFTKTIAETNAETSPPSPSPAETLLKSSAETATEYNTETATNITEVSTPIETKPEIATTEIAAKIESSAETPASSTEVTDKTTSITETKSENIAESETKSTPAETDIARPTFVPETETEETAEPTVLATEEKATDDK